MLFLMLTLSVLLTDVEAQSGNLKPVFTNLTAVAEGRVLSEDLPLGTSIGFVKAVDPEGKQVTYSIGGPASNYLEINANTGEIKIKVRLEFDFGAPPSLSLTVTATDADNQAQTYVTYIVVNDANDNPPSFNQTVYSYTLPENLPVGSNITVLFVTDVDTDNAIITVTCDNSTSQFSRACAVFGLRQTRASNKYWDGYIYLRLSLDYEKEKSYSLRLIAFDGKNSKNQEVQIGVSDVNDSPPYFTRAQGSVIREEIPIGTVIDYVQAVDTDEIEKHQVRYELYGDADARKYFGIDAVSGNITNINRLDYDNGSTPTEFTLQIRARELLQSNPVLLGNDSVTTAVTTITIRLDDINDNCPVFDMLEYTVRVREDIAENSNIPLQMTVTDRDSGERAAFNLTLVQNYLDTYEVIPQLSRSPASVTIAVRNANNIDYERPPTSYDLVVQAQDILPAYDNRPCLQNATIHIQVQDVNDQTPTFSQTRYMTSVYETAPGGTVLITIMARDNETGVYGQAGIRYSLSGNQTLFSINSISGVVTVNTCPTPGVSPCLDYEVKQQYSLAVTATDNNGVNGLSQTVELVINVLNVNDNRPIAPDYVRSIVEGTTVTTDPLILQASDPDGDPLTYDIPPSQQDATLWRVNSTTGNVTAIQPIRYSDLSDQQRGSFIFTATASDGTNSVTINIQIFVIDINDHEPMFYPVTPVYIPETTRGGQFIITVTARDDDSPTTGNGQVGITIDDGSLGKFIIIPRGLENGVWLANITTAPDATFDFDIQKLYNLTLRARDVGSPPRTGSTSVLVNIVDVNNKNPYFDPPTASVTVYENEPIGKVVTKVQAHDQDTNNKLTIFFVQPIVALNPAGQTVDINTFNYSNLFAIDNMTGIVTVNSKLDRDIVNFISFTLFVQDTAANTTQTGLGALFIRILEYNLIAPYFERPLYTFNILEERPTGTYIGSVLAIDDDFISLYQIESNPGNLVSITDTSGVLRVIGRMDYETQHNVTITIRAYDGGVPQLSNTTQCIINIININDNAPIFQQPVYQITIPEETYMAGPVGKCSATDKDEGDYGVVRYRLDDNEPYFTVDPITCDLYLKNDTKLDREKFSTYSFQVTAYDSPFDEKVRLYSSAPVYIILQDINDNCPVFSQPNGYQGSVVESADIGDQVVELYATDRDIGINALIRFRFANNTSPNVTSLFYLDPTNGRIVVQGSLRGQGGTYVFNVTASDLGGDSSLGKMCTTSVPVRVVVQLSINDAPVWILPPQKNFTIDVLESQYLGMIVYNCKATDPNPGEAGTVDYYFRLRSDLVSATPEFQINRVTCVIRAQIVYDREAVDSYPITLVAIDRGDPPASSETVLIVKVLDVNDNQPQFPMTNGETDPYTFYVTEGQSPEAVGDIGTVKAIDLDTDAPNNIILYYIVAGNEDGMFVLNKMTGTLRLNKAVDRETKSQYSMDIRATNDVNDDTVIRNRRRRRSTDPSVVTVNIIVEDIDDSLPYFLKNDYYGCVSADAPYDQSILQVEAVDPDLVGPQSMQYSILADSSNGHFSIGVSSGIVRTAKPLYDISPSVNSLTLKASNDPTASDRMNRTDVKIFVIDTENEAVLVVNQPSSQVRFYQNDLLRVMTNASSGSGSSGQIVYSCVIDINDHVSEDGTVSYTSSDVIVSAVGKDSAGNLVILSSDALAGILNEQRESSSLKASYSSLYVQSIEPVKSEESKLSLTEDPVLAIFIIAIVLIFLAILLIILACCLISNSKTRKTRKLRAERHTTVEVVKQQPAPELVATVNPVYDNNMAVSGGEEYAVVQKRPRPVHVAGRQVSSDVYSTPPILPPMNFEPEPMIVTEPVIDYAMDEPVNSPPSDFYDPEPVIVTEVMPDFEASPPLPRFHEPEIQASHPAPLFHEPEIQASHPAPLFHEPEPVIETEILPEVARRRSLSIPEDEIAVEIRDSPPDSPLLSHSHAPTYSPRSPSPPPSPPHTPSFPRSPTPPSPPRYLPPPTPPRSLSPPLSDSDASSTHDYNFETNFQ